MQSSGLPGASAALESIQAVYQCLLERFGTRPADVVLYGQSVGSGPTAWLAARHPGVAGVVLHSPFLSGVRVLRASLRAWPAALDIFPNIKYVPRIAAPTLVMHVSGGAEPRRCLLCFRRARAVPPPRRRRCQR